MTPNGRAGAAAPPAEAPLTIPVLSGSVRADRMSDRAVRLAVGALEARGHRPVVVDPRALGLPLLERMFKEHLPGTAPEPLQRLAALYSRADGFLVVSAEYNRGIPPALKNLLDHFLEEYFWRPSAILTYSAGRFGGVRAGMALRPVLCELGMPSIPTDLAIPMVAAALDEAGTPVVPWIEPALDRFLAEFAWYARALRAGRRHGTPY